MKPILFIFILTHGVIHILGFVKAFRISEVRQLTMFISRSTGVIWFAAFLLFAITSLLFILKNNYWWLPGIVAVLVSQALIITSWHDAKFGTIANLIILAACVVGYGNWKFISKYENEVKVALTQAPYFSNDNLKEGDLITLPEPVKKYLQYCGCVGKPKVNNFKIKFSGQLRKNEQSEWMPFESVQYNFMTTPTRLFFMKAVMNKLPVTGFHCFKNGDAFMDIRLLSLINVQYLEGKEMDVAETVTFFNDMCCMAPATLIDKRIKWLEIDSNKVNASFTNNNITIFAWLNFNEKGELINFISNDRYSADAGKQLPWSTPLRDYGEINGYRLVGNAETIYSYPDRDLCYGMFQLRDIEYNCKSIE